MSTEAPTSYLREPPEAHPPMDYPAYKSTALRHPKQPLVLLPHRLTEVTGPLLGEELKNAHGTLRGVPMIGRTPLATLPPWLLASWSR